MAKEKTSKIVRKYQTTKRDIKSQSPVYWSSSWQRTKTQSLLHPRAFSFWFRCITEYWAKVEGFQSDNFGEILMIKCVVEISDTVTQKLILYLQIKNMQVKIKYQNKFKYLPWLLEQFFPILSWVKALLGHHSLICYSTAWVLHYYFQEMQKS